VIGLQSSSASASAAVSGNPAAISFYRAVVAATQHQGGVDEVQTGFVVMKDRLGKGVTSVDWTMGSGKPPAAYIPATEYLTVAGNRGKMSWASDRLTPVCGAGMCLALPYQVLLTRSGLFGHLGTSTASGTCWTPVSGSLDYLKVGGPFGYAFVGSWPIEAIREHSGCHFDVPRGVATTAPPRSTPCRRRRTFL
jgi:hypothetical protein